MSLLYLSTNINSSLIADSSLPRRWTGIKKCKPHTASSSAWLMETSWDRVADPDAPPPPVEASLQALVDEVKIVAQEESFILKRAFPYYEMVLVKFLQRVFQQSVGWYYITM